MPDIDVNLVSHPLDDPIMFDTWLTDTLNSGQPIAVDTETYGVEYSERAARLLQFGTADSGWAVPVEWFHKLSEHAM